MNLDAYPIQQTDSLVFTFVSKGRNGDITKVICYESVPKTNDTYNLGFGDYDFETGEIDDKRVSDNGDMKKVMATVIQTLPLFFEMYPEKMVSFSGSDQRRTNFYKRIILLYYAEIKDAYSIKGVSLAGEIVEVDIRKEYKYFIVKKH